MKKLITLVFIITALQSFGQGDVPSRYTEFKFLYGEKKARIWADSILKTDGFFDLKNISTPSNPVAGRLKVYARNDSLFYRNSAGVEVYVGGSGGSSSDSYILPLQKITGTVSIKGLSAIGTAGQMTRSTGTQWEYFTPQYLTRDSLANWGYAVAPPLYVIAGTGSNIDTLAIDTTGFGGGGGSGSVSSVATGLYLSGGPITSTGTILVDSAALFSNALRRKDSVWGGYYPYATNPKNYLVAADLSGYVQSTRTLTINGTAQDLSANRTWNVGTVTSVGSGYGLLGGPITSSGTLRVDTLNTGLTTWLLTKKKIDSIATLIPAAGVTNVASGYGILGGPITSTGTLRIDTLNTGLTTWLRTKKVVDSLSTLIPAAGVTNVASGYGLIGGPITSTGTLKVDTLNTGLTTWLLTKKKIDSLGTILAGKEPTISTGTTSQYIRGDKSLATHSISSLTDATSTSPSHGHILRYDSTTSKYINRGQEYANIADYGAVGDGTTNNNAAFAAAKATGKTILVPKGTYLITTTLTLNDNQSITGVGWESRMKFTGNDRLLAIGGNSRVSNMSFEGAGKSVGGAFNTGIFCYQKFGWVITNCYFTEFSGNPEQNGGGGIYAVSMGAGNTNGGTVTNNYFDNNDAALLFGSRGEYVTVTGNRFGSNNAAVCLGGGNNTINANIIQNNLIGVKHINGTNVGHSIISNNLINHNTYPLWFEDVAHDVGMEVSSNMIYYGAFKFINSSNIKITGGNIDLLDSIVVNNSTAIQFNSLYLGSNPSSAKIPENVYNGGQQIAYANLIRRTSGTPGFATRQASADTVSWKGPLYHSGVLPTSGSSLDSILVKSSTGQFKLLSQNDITGSGGGTSGLEEVSDDGDATANIWLNTTTSRIGYVSGAYIYHLAITDSAAVPVTYDTDAQTYFTAVEATGATISDNHKLAYNNWVIAEKAAGTYSKRTQIFPFMGGTAAAHAINAKSPGTLNGTFNGTWTHSANGINGGGTNSDYFNTGQQPLDFGQNDVHISIYINNDMGTTSGYDMGAYSSAAINIAFTSSGTNAYTNCNNGGDQATTTTNSLGYTTVTRVSSTDYYFVKNGTSVTKTVASVGLSSADMRLGNPGGVNAPSGRRYAFASFGTGLTSAEAVAADARMVTLQTALGRN